MMKPANQFPRSRASPESRTMDSLQPQHQNLKPQALDADACGLHPTGLKPRRDFKLELLNLPA